jgi:SAM-dependent methyltransferase
MTISSSQKRSDEVGPSSDSEVCPFCLSGQTHRSTTWRDPDWTIMRCTACATEYVAPMPSEEDLHGLYEWSRYASPLYQRRDAVSDKNLLVATQFLEEAESLTGGTKRLLEIGCSTGLLMRVARDRNWEVHGIEWDGKTADYARTTFGLDVVTGNALSALDVVEGKFDLIVLSHVIEHVPYPRKLLEEVVCHLSPGGVIAIRVPNAGSKMVRFVGRSWGWYQPPIHLIYFTADSFGVVSDQLGLSLASVVARKGEGNSLPLELLKAVFKVLLGRRSRNLVGSMESVVVYRSGVESLRRAVLRAMETIDKLTPWTFFTRSDDFELTVFLILPT